MAYTDNSGRVYKYFNGQWPHNPDGVLDVIMSEYSERIRAMGDADRAVQEQEIEKVIAGELTEIGEQND